MPSIQDLDRRFPIVNPDGTPSDYFLRLINDRGTTQTEDQQTVETLAAEVTLLEGQLAGKADKTTQINAGFGLAGGGDLSTDRTLSLDATLDDLSDVIITSPVTNDVIKFDGTGWINGAGGGGGGGGGSPTPIYATNPASTTSTSSFASKGALIQPFSDISVTRITQYIAATGGTYKATIFACDSGGVVSAILGESTAQVKTGTGLHIFDLASSVTLTAGQYYGVVVTLTSATATTSSGAYSANADPSPAPLYTVNKYLRFATTAPAVGQNYEDAANAFNIGIVYTAAGASISGGQTLLPYPAVDPLANSGALATNQIFVSQVPCHSATPITGIVFPFRAVPAGLQIAPCIYDGGPISTTPIQPNSTSLVASGPAITPVAQAFNKAPFSSVFTPTVDRIYFVGFAVTGGGNFNFMAPIGNRRAWWNSGSHVPPPATFPASTTNGSGNWVAWWTY